MTQSWPAVACRPTQGSKLVSGKEIGVAWQTVLLLVCYFLIRRVIEVQMHIFYIRKTLNMLKKKNGPSPHYIKETWKT